jgi:plastocyanin
MRIYTVAVLLLLAFGAPLASAAALKGQVKLTGGDGPTSVGDFQDTVVFYTPDAKTKVRPLASGNSITMRGKSFVPHVLTVTTGSAVKFPNGDPILHNIFSTTPGDSFDLGLYGPGVSKSVTFEHAGLVRVYCNVHHEMFAYVLVLDTPFYTHPDAAGSFELDSLPAGPGELTVWNPRGEVFRQHLDTPAAEPLAIEIKLNRFAIPAHFNKFGKPYEKNAEPGY